MRPPLAALFVVAFVSCSTPATDAVAWQQSAEVHGEGSARHVLYASASDAGPTSGTDATLVSPLSGERAIDRELGERAWPGEAESAGRITQAIAADIRRRHQPGAEQARRDAHPKAHGCVRATFQVRDDLSAKLAHGVLQRSARYRAWIRFSNGDGDPKRPDGEGDARGMAIKLVDVGGAKLSDDETRTQDFIMITHPVFFADDPQRYAVLIERAMNPSMLVKLTAPLALGVRGALIAREIRATRIGNPLHARYWSGVPYRLGEGAAASVVKFSARPCVARDNTPTASSGDDPDYLRKAMRATLAAEDACFELLVQPRNSPSLSVEDSMVEWTEAEAPFIPVARITIDKQDFDSPAQHAFCENLSFSPWHALAAHRPLGAVNRVRRVVYDQISELRHELNGQPRIEPSGEETFQP